MRLFAFFLVFMVVVSAAQISPSVIPVESSLTKVTVYRDRALVQRTAKFSVPKAGDYTLHARGVYGSEASSIFDSLRVSKMTEGVILGTSHVVRLPRLAAGVAPSLKEMENLTDTLSRVQRDEKRVTDDIQTVEKVLSAVDNMANVVASSQGGNDRAKVFDFEGLEQYRVRRTKYLSELRELREELASVSAKAKAIQEDIINQTRPLGDEDVLTIQVRAKENVQVCVVVFEYVVYGASWRPTYNVRASVAEEKVSLEYNAFVTQQTPEDWVDVPIDLSTAVPHAGVRPPEVQPWRLQRAQPIVVQEVYHRPKRMMARSAGRFEKASADEMDVAGSAAVGVSLQTPQVEAAAVTPSTGGFSVQSYTIAGRHTIRRGGIEQRLTITNIDFPATFSYTTAPSLQQIAFLQTTCTNTSPYAMLPGEASVYDDTGFVAKTTLPSVLPNEEFNIPLGRDEGIAVKHTLIKRARSDRGGFVTQKIITWDFAYEVTLHNRKDVSATLTVYDRVPVSSEENIVVNLSPPADVDLGKTNEDGVSLSEQGILQIKKTLSPGEKITVPIKYSVTFPADLQVEGF